MTEAPERTTVTSLTDLVEVVPSLLGFHPHESLVLLAIRDGMVQLTARTDLFDAPPARALAPAWHRLPGAHFVVIAFSADAGCAWWGLDDVDLALPGDAERILVHADGERWYEHPDDEGRPTTRWAACCWPRRRTPGGRSGARGRSCTRSWNPTGRRRR